MVCVRILLRKTPIWVLRYPTLTFHRFEVLSSVVLSSVTIDWARKCVDLVGPHSFVLAWREKIIAKGKRSSLDGVCPSIPSPDDIHWQIFTTTMIDVIKSEKSSSRREISFDRHFPRWLNVFRWHFIGIDSIPVTKDLKCFSSMICCDLSDVHEICLDASILSVDTEGRWTTRISIDAHWHIGAGRIIHLNEKESWRSTIHLHISIAIELAWWFPRNCLPIFFFFVFLHWKEKRKEFLFNLKIFDDTKIVRRSIEDPSEKMWGKRRNHFLSIRRENPLNLSFTVPQFLDEQFHRLTTKQFEIFEKSKANVVDNSLPFISVHIDTNSEERWQRHWRHKFLRSDNLHLEPHPQEARHWIRSHNFARELTKDRAKENLTKEKNDGEMSSSEFISKLTRTRTLNSVTLKHNKWGSPMQNIVDGWSTPSLGRRSSTLFEQRSTRVEQRFMAMTSSSRDMAETRDNEVAVDRLDRHWTIHLTAMHPNSTSRLEWIEATGENHWNKLKWRTERKKNSLHGFLFDGHEQGSTVDGKQRAMHFAQLQFRRGRRESFSSVTSTNVSPDRRAALKWSKNSFNRQRRSNSVVSIFFRLRLRRAKSCLSEGKTKIKTSRRQRDSAGCPSWRVNLLSVQRRSDLVKCVSPRQSIISPWNLSIEGETRRFQADICQRWTNLRNIDRRWIIRPWRTIVGKAFSNNAFGRTEGHHPSSTSLVGQRRRNHQLDIHSMHRWSTREEQRRSVRWMTSIHRGKGKGYRSSSKREFLRRNVDRSVWPSRRGRRTFVVPFLSLFSIGKTRSFRYTSITTNWRRRRRRSRRRCERPVEMGKEMWRGECRWQWRRINAGRFPSRRNSSDEKSNEMSREREKERFVLRDVHCHRTDHGGNTCPTDHNAVFRWSIRWKSSPSTMETSPSSLRPARQMKRNSSHSSQMEIEMNSCLDHGGHMLSRGVMENIIRFRLHGWKDGWGRKLSLSSNVCRLSRMAMGDRWSMSRRCDWGSSSSSSMFLGLEWSSIEQFNSSRFAMPRKSSRCCCPCITNLWQNSSLFDTRHRQRTGVKAKIPNENILFDVCLFFSVVDLQDDSMSQMTLLIVSMIMNGGRRNEHDDVQWWWWTGRWDSRETLFDWPRGMNQFSSNKRKDIWNSSRQINGIFFNGILCRCRCPPQTGLHFFVVSPRKKFLQWRHPSESTRRRKTPFSSTLIRTFASRDRVPVKVRRTRQDGEQKCLTCERTN